MAAYSRACPSSSPPIDPGVSDNCRRSSRLIDYQVLVLYDSRSVRTSRWRLPRSVVQPFGQTVELSLDILIAAVNPVKPTSNSIRTAATVPRLSQEARLPIVLQELKSMLSPYRFPTNKPSTHTPIHIYTCYAIWGPFVTPSASPFVTQSGGPR